MFSFLGNAMQRCNNLLFVDSEDIEVSGNNANSYGNAGRQFVTRNTYIAIRSLQNTMRHTQKHRNYRHKSCDYWESAIVKKIFCIFVQ